MSQFIDKPKKIVPVAVATYLLYKIYVCPCDTFMKCNPILRWFLPGLLMFFSLTDFPLK